MNNLNIGSFIYLIPTVFTAGNMFCGVYSIILSIRGEFVRSCWMIILGIVLDGIDGAIARTRKLVSKLGVELDSLSDFLTFSIAPAVLIWQMIAYHYGFRGIIMCFIYVFFSALRLARFNIKMMNEQQVKSVITSFDGLPTPAAAGVIASIVLLISVFSGETSISKRHITLFLTLVPWLLNLFPAIVLFLSILMISKLQYPKINNIKLTQKISIKLFSLLFILFLLIFSYPESSIFLIFSLYVLWGMIEYLLKISRIFKHHK